jgi:hypothetical protein
MADNKKKNAQGAPKAQPGAASEGNTYPKTIALPSGATAEIAAFKGYHIREAQKIAGDDTDKMVFALIALTTTIDGRAVTMEDIDEGDGFDAMRLMKEFSGNF